MEDDGTMALERVSGLHLMEHTSDAVVLLDRSGRIVRRNRSSAEVLAGIDLEGILANAGSHSPELETFHSELHARGRARTELQHTTVLGTRWLRFEASSVDGLCLLVVRDVTHARLLADEVRQLRRVASSGLLALSIAHDLANLLTPIQTLSALLAEGRCSDETDARALASDVAYAADRAFGLVRELLTFVRRRQRSVERVDVNQRLNEMRTLLHHVLGNGIEIELSLEDGVGGCVVDREQFEHVILNLAANARDAMPHGGRVVIRTQPAACVPRHEGADGHASDGDGHIALSVSDTGVGIPPEIRARVFEQFFTTKAPGSGTGLGLASAHRFAIESGGQIELQSEQGEGTTVTLYLPHVELADAAESGSLAHVG